MPHGSVPVGRLLILLAVAPLVVWITFSCSRLDSTKTSFGVAPAASAPPLQNFPTATAQETAAAGTELVTSKPEWNPPADRFECVQRWIYRTFGYDHIPDFFVPGCDFPAVWGFEKWAQESQCPAITGPTELQMHTAWLGPIDGIVVELIALIDSFLATQHTADGRASLTIWFMESEPPPASSMLRQRYRSHDGTAVRFKRVDLKSLAIGTCLEGKPEYLDVKVAGVDWKRRGTMGPKEKADMTRLLLLHAYGGVWVDTDSVLLRDFRPLVDFAGPDFAAKVTLSPYYNNNAIGLAKGGTVAQKLLQIVCDTPFTPKGRASYCSVVGTPCYPKWYWNHGVIQLAVRRKIGLVVLPWTYTDPAYGCFPPMLLSGAGGKPARNLNIEDALEVIRGAFVLHTRGYNAAKPLNNHSAFAKLYLRAERLAASRPAPEGGVGAHLFRALGPRSTEELVRFRQLLSSRGPNVVEPTFVPRFPESNVSVQLQTARFGGMCLTANRARSIGEYPSIGLGPCAADRAKDKETRLWRFQGALPSFNATRGDTGYLRPALVDDLGSGMWGRIMCLSALPWHSKDDWSGEPCLIVCHPNSSSQRWVLDVSTGQIRNHGLNGMCLQAIERTPPTAVTRLCHPLHSVGKSQKWIVKRV